MLPKAKADRLYNQSDSIVVSFNAKWHDPLIKKKFNCIIRKRTPKTITAKYLYFHINAPISSICAKAKIKSISDIDLDSAIKLKRNLYLNDYEIKNYFGDIKTIGCYFLANIELAKRELSLNTLRKHFEYYPPQSFLILAKESKKKINKLAGLTLK